MGSDNGLKANVINELWNRFKNPWRFSFGWHFFLV